MTSGAGAVRVVGVGDLGTEGRARDDFSDGEGTATAEEVAPGLPHPRATPSEYLQGRYTSIR